MPLLLILNTEFHKPFFVQSLKQNRIYYKTRTHIPRNQAGKLTNHGGSSFPAFRTHWTKRICNESQYASIQKSRHQYPVLVTIVSKIFLSRVLLFFRQFRQTHVWNWIFVHNHILRKRSDLTLSRYLFFIFAAARYKSLDSTAVRLRFLDLCRNKKYNIVWIKMSSLQVIKTQQNPLTALRIFLFSNKGLAVLSWELPEIPLIIATKISSRFRSYPWMETLLINSRPNSVVRQRAV